MVSKIIIDFLNPNLKDLFCSDRKWGVNTIKCLYLILAIFQKSLRIASTNKAGTHFFKFERARFVYQCGDKILEQIFIRMSHMNPLTVLKRCYFLLLFFCT